MSDSNFRLTVKRIHTSLKLAFCTNDLYGWPNSSVLILKHSVFICHVTPGSLKCCPHLFTSDSLETAFLLWVYIIPTETEVALLLLRETLSKLQLLNGVCEEISLTKGWWKKMFGAQVASRSQSSFMAMFLRDSIDVILYSRNVQGHKI